MGQRWWGPSRLDEGQQLGWRIGPLKLWLYRDATEWRITTESLDDSVDPHVEVASLAGETPGEDATLQRFGFEKTEPGFELRPIATDRPVIVKSDAPFFVAPQATATIYVSSPIRVQFFLARRKEPLAEFATYRPSDTWFGPSTLEGELCYAARTSARLHLPNVPIHPHRAVSVVKIRNEAKEPLALERLRLPLPHLSLYAGENNRLWTEQLTLVREEVGEMARVSFSQGAPKQAVGAKRVAESRLKPGKGLLLRSFGGLRMLAPGVARDE